MKKPLAFILVLSLILLACPVKSAAATVSDFSDVQTGDWYYGAVSFVTQNGMFNGSTTTTFSPNGTMTRGMFVTVLGRYCNAPASTEGYQLGIIFKADVNMGSAPSTQNTTVLACLSVNTQVEVVSQAADTDDASYSWYYIKYNGMFGYVRSDFVAVIDSGFEDVPADAYYSPYVQWAFSSGIASDTGEGTFSPDRDITREEICTMLYNLSNYKNVQLKPTVAALSFSDGASISSGAAAAVPALQQTGVITGYNDGSFRPQGSATRAEVSAMLMRFLGAISYKPVTEPSYDANGNYIFGTELPQTAAVGADYFSDACFIGHSLVNGMRSYLGFSSTDFFAKNGASAKYFTSYTDLELASTHLDDKGYTVRDKGSLEDAMKYKSYNKVYIMLGVNEIGTSAASAKSFYTSMSGIIELVRKYQPNAKIYLISLTPVSQTCSESNKSINRDNIIAFNGVLKQLCKDKKAYYLNVFDLLCDNGGFLPDGAAMSDGIHLLASQYAKIKTYLLNHAL